MRGVRTIGIRGGRSVVLGETDGVEVEVEWWEEGVRGKGGLVKEVGGVDISLSGYLALQKHVVLLSFPFLFLPLETLIPPHACSLQS